MNNELGMRNFFVICFLFFFFASFNTAFAVIGITEPLIPCGLSVDDPDSATIETASCTFCHFFKLIQNVYNFLVFVIVPPIAVLLVAIGGFFWLSSGGSEARAKTALNILIAVLWGLVIVYVSWLVISFAISLIANPAGVSYKPAKWYNPTEWFVGSCEATGPVSPTGCTAQNLLLSWAEDTDGDGIPDAELTAQVGTGKLVYADVTYAACNNQSATLNIKSNGTPVPGGTGTSIFNNTGEYFISYRTTENDCGVTGTSLGSLAFDVEVTNPDGSKFTVTSNSLGVSCPL